MIIKCMENDIFFKQCRLDNIIVVWSIFDDISCIGIIKYNIFPLSSCFVGICPHGYAHTRLFDYCVGYEGHFTDDVGFQKCREKSGRYMLIQSPEENRFASLLACKSAFLIYIFCA